MLSRYLHASVIAASLTFFATELPAMASNPAGKCEAEFVQKANDFWKGTLGYREIPKSDLRTFSQNPSSAPIVKAMQQQGIKLIFGAFASDTTQVFLGAENRSSSIIMIIFSPPDGFLTFEGAASIALFDSSKHLDSFPATSSLVPVEKSNSGFNSNELRFSYRYEPQDMKVAYEVNSRITNERLLDATVSVNPACLLE